MEGPYSTNADRLEYLYLNLVGQLVHVRMVDGTCVEGIFVSRTDVDVDTEAGILLCCTRYTPSSVHKALDPSCAEFDEDTIIPYRDIVMVEVPNSKLRTEAPGRTDAPRSDFHLKKFDWADDGANELLDTETHQTGGWDQFETNERNFGVKTTYREEIYTTHLDRTKFTEEQKADADRVAGEIVGSATRGIAHRMERDEMLKGDEGLDEGTLYSDVQRTEPDKKRAYAPPSAPNRKAAETPAAPIANVNSNNTNAAAVAAAPVEDGMGRGKARHGEEERAAMQHDGHPRPPGFNPAAIPYTPPKQGQAAAPVLEFLTSLANAITQDAQCYTSTAEWPCQATTNMYYDQDDSDYSRNAAYEPPTIQPPPPMQNMYAGPPTMPMPSRPYQGGGRMGVAASHMGMNQVHPQSYHQHHQQQHQHQHPHPQYQPPPHQQQQALYYSPQPNVSHHNAPMPEYGSPKGAAPSMPRNAVRPQKSSASRVEPQQPVSTNPAAPPAPVPTVDGAPSQEVRTGPRLQRGRGAAAAHRGEEGGQGNDGGNNNAGPKRRGGK